MPNRLNLFIHGLGCTADSWRELSTYSHGLEGEIWAPNLPGFGNEAAPTGFLFTLEEQSAWLGQEIRRRNPSELRIVAHSMGGAIGLLLEEDLQRKLSTFISVEGNLIPEDCSLISRQVAATPFDQFARVDFPRLQHKWDNLGVTGISLAQTSARAFHASCRSLVHWSDSGVLKRRFLNLPCRRAYLFGDRNTHLPVLQQLPRTLCHRISNSGHFVMHDNPTAFYSLLTQLLAKH